MRLALIQIWWTRLSRLKLHVIVRVSLRYAPKTQALVKLKRPAIFQASRKTDLLTSRMGPSNRVEQNTCTNAAALVGRLDLNLANL